jgi:hypothetical protein
MIAMIALWDKPWLPWGSLVMVGVAAGADDAADDPKIGDEADVVVKLEMVVSLEVEVVNVGDDVRVEEIGVVVEVIGVAVEMEDGVDVGIAVEVGLGVAVEDVVGVNVEDDVVVGAGVAVEAGDVDPPYTHSGPSGI